jgi:protein-S-isoprenylcysteine O-methyltransferase Ste14
MEHNKNNFGMQRHNGRAVSRGIMAAISKGSGDSMNAAEAVPFERTKAYDLLMGLPLGAWFGWGVWREVLPIVAHLNAIANGTENFLGFLQFVALVASVVFSLILIALLFVRTVPRAKAQGIVPRLAAVLGTFLGTAFLLLPAHQLPVWLQALADAMIIAGTVSCILVILRLGKAFAIMPEARELVTSGPYAIVRHPLYVAEELGVWGMVIQFAGPLAFALLLGRLTLQITRTVFEERVLAATFPQYEEYRARTWRFIPGLI